MIKRKGIWHGLFFVFLALVLASSLALAACGGDDNDVSPTTQAPSVTTVAPTTAAPTVNVPAAPAVPEGWQTAQTASDAAIAQAAKDLGFDFYFPADWITMTQPGIPVLALDPTFFPNTMVSTIDVPAGTTPADMPEYEKNHLPTDKGGDTDNFKVLEEGTFTFDIGVTSPYMCYTGSRMGYNTEQIHTYMINGTTAYVIGASDYPVTFSDSREKVESVLKTFHPTSWVPVPGPTPGTTVFYTPAATATAVPTTVAPTEEATVAPTVVPTTVAPTEEATVAPTVAPTTVAPTETAAPTAVIHTGLDENSTVGALLANPYTLAIIDKWVPGMSTNPQIGMVSGMPLTTVYGMAPATYTTEVKAGLAADFAAIK